MTTFIAQVVGLLVLGAMLYVGDRVFGVGIKRVLWNATHSPKNKMKKEQEVGFIYGQRVRMRLFTVTTLMALQFAVSFILLHLELTGLMFWSVVGVVVMTVGTYLGPFLDKMFGVADVSLKRIEVVEERISRGDTTLRDEFVGAAQTAAERARSSFRVADPPASEPTAASKPAAPSEPAEPDPAAAFKKFTEGRG
jgi:hypothetical protein